MKKSTLLLLSLTIAVLIAILSLSGCATSTKAPVAKFVAPELEVEEVADPQATAVAGAKRRVGEGPSIRVLLKRFYHRAYVRQPPATGAQASTDPRDILQLFSPELRRQLARDYRDLVLPKLPGKVRSVEKPKLLVDTTSVLYPRSGRPIAIAETRFSAVYDLGGGRTVNVAVSGRYMLVKTFAGGPSGGWRIFDYKVKQRVDADEVKT